MSGSMSKQRKGLLLFFLACMCAAIFFSFSLPETRQDRELHFTDKETYLSNGQYAQREALFKVYDTSSCQFCFVGDSITQLIDFNELLDIKGGINRGIGSDTTEGVAARIGGVVKTHPKYIFMMIGINDLSLSFTKEETIQNYEYMLDYLTRELPDTELYVESILPIYGGGGRRYKE